jgi:hypothetical protein
MQLVKTGAMQQMPAQVRPWVVTTKMARRQQMTRIIDPCQLEEVRFHLRRQVSGAK